jgi:hypothetical protein
MDASQIRTRLTDDQSKFSCTSVSRVFSNSLLTFGHSQPKPLTFETFN